MASTVQIAMNWIVGRSLRMTLWHVALENRCRHLADASALDQLALVSHAPCVVLLVLDVLQSSDRCGVADMRVLLRLW